jgi:hypothetical protein
VGPAGDQNLIATTWDLDDKLTRTVREPGEQGFQLGDALARILAEEVIRVAYATVPGVAGRCLSERWREDRGRWPVVGHAAKFNRRKDEAIAALLIENEVEYWVSLREWGTLNNLWQLPIDPRVYRFPLSLPGLQPEPQIAE